MELHYQVWGDHGEPVLVLHGLFGSLANWRTVAKLLAADFRIFVVDQRNHGRSPHSDEFSYETLAADALAFIDRHALGPVVVLGHSMGGKVAMRTALDHPERVSRLIVVDIAPTKQSEGLRPVLDAMMAVDPGTCASREAVDRELEKRIADARLRQFLLTNVARRMDGSLAWRLNLAAIAASFAELAAAVVATNSYPGPTLFVRGEKSDYVRDADMPSIVGAFPAAQVVTIPDAGHWVHAEAPAALVRVISDFLSRTAGSD